MPPRYLMNRHLKKQEDRIREIEAHYDLRTAQLKAALIALHNKTSTVREQEEALGLLDKTNTALRVKWVNALRAIVGAEMPKNKSGVSLVSDIDLILASDDQRLMALDKIK
jgi:hypothetical protein